MIFQMSSRGLDAKPGGCLPKETLAKSKQSHPKITHADAAEPKKFVWAASTAVCDHSILSAQKLLSLTDSTDCQ